MRSTARSLAWPWLAAGLLVLLGVVGCGGGSASSPEAAAVEVRAHGFVATRGELGDTLNLFIYPDYLDPSLLEEFEKTYGVRVVVDYYDTNEALITKLQAGGVGLYDVVVPSGYGAATLLEMGLLEPLDLARLPNRANLMKRFLDPPFDAGGRHTLCYLWGTTGIGYRKDRLPAGKAPPTSWKALFDPSVAYGPFAMLDDQRETMAAALIHLGLPVNTRNPDEIRAAEQVLIAQRARVLAYASSSTGRDMLSSGDVVLVHDYSGDVAMARSENPEVVYVIPEEGASIWTDNMAIPKGAPHRVAAHAFLNFLLDPAAGAKLANFTKYATPNQAALPSIDEALRTDPALYPDEATQARLQYITPVGEATRLYAESWTRIKAAGG